MQILASYENVYIVCVFDCCREQVNTKPWDKKSDTGKLNAVASKAKPKPAA